MPLPSSGLITAEMINEEIGRSSNASFNLNDPDLRALAGKPSGAISFSDFYGKSTVVTLSPTGTPLVLKGLFDPAVWAADISKRVIIPAGTHIGDGTGANYALATTATAQGQAGSFGGTLTLENRGVISGRGGAANSGVGGNAILSNFPGKDGQKLLIENYGTIRAGGGGGGKGGTGGNGTYNYTFREPTSGWRDNSNNRWVESRTGDNSDEYTYYITLRWGGSNLIVLGASGNPYTPPSTYNYGGWTYLRGAETSQFPFPGSRRWQIARRQTRSDSSTGGAGGNGGRGQGYDGAQAAGAAGAAGGQNAGTGGTGGTGGTYGNSGNTGATGGNGNVSNGTAGTAGGLAGFVVTNAANVTWVANGTRQGRL